MQAVARVLGAKQNIASQGRRSSEQRNATGFAAPVSPARCRDRRVIEAAHWVGQAGPLRREPNRVLLWRVEASLLPTLARQPPTDRSTKTTKCCAAVGSSTTGDATTGDAPAADATAAVATAADATRPPGEATQPPPMPQADTKTIPSTSSRPFHRSQILCGTSVNTAAENKKARRRRLAPSPLL